MHFDRLIKFEYFIFHMKTQILKSMGVAIEERRLLASYYAI